MKKNQQIFKAVQLALLLLLAVSTNAQDIYLRGTEAACGWSNTDAPCKLTNIGGSVFEVTLNVTGGRQEFKIFNQTANTWHPNNNAWYNAAGNTTFRINTATNQVEVLDQGTVTPCAPGAHASWTNTLPMTNPAANKWCMTVATAGTYDWKPTNCGSWDSWSPTTGERDANSGNWSVTTTVANSVACINYQPTTGKMTTTVTLPVELAAFTAKALNGKVNLTWQTAAEINSKHFAIERSEDGRNWTNIGVVNAEGKANNYQFVDKTPAYGANYYRLQLVDLDGSEKYSKTVTADNRNKIGSNLVVTPNPATTQLAVYGSEVDNGSMVHIFDVSGRLVKTTPNDGRLVEVTDLAKGMYWIRLINKEGSLVGQTRFVKM